MMICVQVLFNATGVYMAAHYDAPGIVLVHRSIVKRSDGRILIVRRSPDDRHNARLWEFPGGKVEKGQDLHAAAKREVLEETGFVVQVAVPIITYTTHIITDGVYAGMLYLALFSITKFLGGKLKLSHEHTDHRWATYAEMMDFNLTCEVREAAIVLKSRILAA